MPFTIDESKMQQGSAEQILNLDPAKPPVKFIPFAQFPQCVYKHPLAPFRKEEIRNNQQEVVKTELVANEHLSQVVADQAELDKALADGWVKNPFVPVTPPDPRAAIYEDKKAAKK